jgi:hypothetical protein
MTTDTAATVCTECGEPTTAYDGICLACRFPIKCTGCGQRLLLNRPGRTACARCDPSQLALRPADYPEVAR